MKTLEVKGKEFRIIDSWNDITVEKYIEIAILHSKIEDMVEEQFLVDFIKIISDLTDDFINNLYEEDLLFFIELMNIFNISKLEPIKTNHFIFNDKLYSYNDVGKLTLGEKISLKLLEKNNKSEHETWYNILSILIRPANKKINEFNEEVFEVEPFIGDIEIITKRKELVKKIPAVNALHIIQSFTIGRE
jgi:hypothetical protein